jgi:hypothetical protein
MPRTVQEIMNRELLALRPDLPAREVPAMLRSYGVGAAPVLDDGGHPIGMLSLRDVLDVDGSAADRMTRPALCISAATRIDDAARQLARGDTHHLVVVDSGGAAIGMVSTQDALRALLDMPARHPATFPHWDEGTGVSWTDDWTLDEESTAHAPDAPGVLALVTGHRGERDAIVWVEGCANVRARALEFASRPTEQEPALVRLLVLRGLRFRAAIVQDDSARARVVAGIRERIDHLPPPGGT